MLDATPLLILYIPENSVTCRHVLAEVLNKKSRDIIRGLYEGGLVKVKEPKRRSIEFILRFSRELGEDRKISIADLHVISLAYELRQEGEDVVVITDDFSIQNILSRLGIDYRAVRRGIRRSIKWIYVCRMCGKVFKNLPSNGVCTICGGEVYRRPLI